MNYQIYLGLPLLDNIFSHNASCLVGITPAVKSKLDYETHSCLSNAVGKVFIIFKHLIENE